MNQSQLLAKKYGLPESRKILVHVEDSSFGGRHEPKAIPLNRDIESLITLALEHDVFICLDKRNKVVVVENETASVARSQAHDKHPTKLDALCECLCQALLSE